MRNRIIVFALLVIMATNNIAFAQQVNPLTDFQKYLDFARKLSSANSTNDVLTALCVLTQDPRCLAISALLNFFSSFLDATSSLPVSNVKATREVYGQEAYDILKTWGLLKPGVTPANAVVVMVETKDGVVAAYTREELMSAGWRYNSQTGMWVPGPEGKDLPPRVSLRVTTKAEGPTEVIVSTDIPIMVHWEAQALKPDGSVIDRTSGTVQTVVPGSNHRVPKCDNVYEGGFALPQGIGSAGFRYVYHSYAVATALGEGSAQQKKCNEIIEQPTMVSLYSDKRLLTVYVEGDSGSRDGAYRRPSDETFRGLLNAIEERTASDKNATSPGRSLSSGFGSSLGSGLGSGLGLGSAFSANRNTLRTAIDEMSRYQFSDPRDAENFQAYLNEERYMLENAQDEVEYKRIGLRLLSVDEMIRSNRYTPGRLGEAIQQTLRNITVDSDIIGRLLAHPQMNTESGDRVEKLIYSFISQFPASLD